MGIRNALAALLAAFTCSCFCAPRAPIYAPITLESGVVVQDIVIPEEGAAVQVGDHIVLHYKMMLEDGSVVDSSFDRGQPIELEVGAGSLPVGLEEGLLGMRLFGIRNLIVPAELGYGSEGLEGQVPPHTLLRFMLELMGLNPAK